MVTREDVENIALLSKLFVDPNELDGLTKEMQRIIDFADTINNAEECTEEFDNINNLSNAFREDIVVESFSCEDILSNAPDKANDSFLVRKKA